MFKKSPTPTQKTMVLLLMVTVLAFGCSKKQQAVAATPTDTDTSAVAATPAGSQAANIPSSTDLKQSFADVDEALKEKAYLKAVQIMLAIKPQTHLTDQQA